ncbi:MAG: succinylglutamate desuccinylase/aspartoacylase family protein [Candidatus Aminicenantes bacterium]|nr:MAG: succinylglutamate desuccinylase/aspartoacylase family protein [Candidatus Aminicenantes bacterium]
MKKHQATAFLLLLLAALVCFFAGREFLTMHEEEAVYPSPHLTIKKRLSDYFPGLKNSPGDSSVYIFEGQKMGGTLLILGGTHPNEPAGFITAVLLVENLEVTQGKVIIVPRANNSGFMHSDPQEGNPQRYSLSTPGGPRWFRYGSRLTNPIHQWPDSVLYVNPAGQKLSGTESRNLNRSYPGRKHGKLTEKIAYAIMQVIDNEKADLAVDLHEAAPEYPVINAIVFHENSAELAAVTLMTLQMEGVDIRLEASPPNLRGLSHREWGDFAKTRAVLLETANTSHGRLKGRPSATLIINGKDKNYMKAAQLGLLFVPFDEDGISLKQRVSRHLASLRALVSGLHELHPDLCIQLDNLPNPIEVQKVGIGPYLTPSK